MLRMRFGKLAIAVLAVSGAAAHADVVEGSFFSKFTRFSKMGVEFMGAPFVSEGNALLPTNFKKIWPINDSIVAGAHVESPVLGELGPFKIKYRAGISYLGAAGMHNSSAIVEAAKAEVEGAESKVDATLTATPKNRESNEVQGVFFQVLGADATAALSSSVYGSLGLGAGIVEPILNWKKPYAGVNVRGALGYKFNSAVSAEIGAKYIAAPFDAFVNSVGGFTLGVNYNY